MVKKGASRARHDRGDPGMTLAVAPGITLETCTPSQALALAIHTTAALGNSPLNLEGRERRPILVAGCKRRLHRWTFELVVAGARS